MMKDKNAVFRIQDIVKETEFSYLFLDPIWLSTPWLQFIKHNEPVILPDLKEVRRPHSSFYSDLNKKRAVLSLNDMLWRWYGHFVDGQDKIVYCTDKTLSLSLNPVNTGQVQEINEYFLGRAVFTLFNTNRSPCYKKSFIDRKYRLHDVSLESGKFIEELVRARDELLAEREKGPFFEKVFEVVSLLKTSPIIAHTRIWSYSQTIVMAYAMHAAQFLTYIDKELLRRQSILINNMLQSKGFLIWSN